MICPSFLLFSSGSVTIHHKTAQHSTDGLAAAYFQYTHIASAHHIKCLGLSSGQTIFTQNILLALFASKMESICLSNLSLNVWIYS